MPESKLSVKDQAALERLGLPYDEYHSEETETQRELLNSPYFEEIQELITALENLQIDEQRKTEFRDILNRFLLGSARFFNNPEHIDESGDVKDDFQEQARTIKQEYDNLSEHLFLLEDRSSILTKLYKKLRNRFSGKKDQ